MQLKIKLLKEQIKGNLLFKGMFIFSVGSIIMAFLLKNIIPAIFFTALLLGSRILVNIAWKKAFDPLLYLISNLTQFGTYLILFMIFPILWQSVFIYNLNWYISVLIIISANVIFFAVWEYVSWPKRVVEWEKIGKMILSKNQFNVLAPWRMMSKKEDKVLNIGLYIIPTIATIFVLLTERLIGGLQNAIMKVVLLVLGLIFGAIVGQYSIWVIKIAKLQRNGANLRTEYSRILQNMN